MNKKPSYSGIIVVLLSLAFMLYYYLIYRHAIERQLQQYPTRIDNSANI